MDAAALHGVCAEAVAQDIQRPVQPAAARLFLGRGQAAPAAAPGASRRAGQEELLRRGLEARHAQADEAYGLAGVFLFQQFARGLEDGRGGVGAAAERAGARDLAKIRELDLEGDGAPGQAVAPQARAHAFGMGEERPAEQFPVAHISGKGALRAFALDLVLRRHGPRVDAAGALMQHQPPLAVAPFEKFAAQGAKPRHARDAQAAQALGHAPAHAGQPRHLQGQEKVVHRFRRQDEDAVGLVHFGTDLGEEFHRRQAHRTGEAARDLGHARLDGAGKGFGRPEQAFQPGGVQIGLVDAGRLHGRRKFAQARHDAGGKLAVARPPSPEENALRAEPPGRGHGHGRVDAEAPGLIGSRGDDPAPVAADDDRPAPKRGIVQLLHGGEERIHVQMEDHGGLPAAPIARARARVGADVWQTFLMRPEPWSDPINALPVGMRRVVHCFGRRAEKLPFSPANKKT